MAAHDRFGNSVVLDRFLSSPSKVAIVVFVSALAFYVIAGWDIGADALDSDTLSLVLEWRLVRDGVVLDDWILSTPKFLPVVVDGSLYQLGGEGAVLARSLLTSALLIALAAAFVHVTAGWQASLTAAGLLLLNRAIFTSAFGGNSTVLYVAFLTGAALCFLRWPSRRAVVAGLLLLFAASLERIEGLSYLGLAAVMVCVASWNRDRKFVLLTATAAAGLIATTFLADLWVPTMLSGRLRSARSVALEINEQAKRTADARTAENAYSQALARIEQSYGAVAPALLGRMLRPGLLFLAMSVTGCALLWKRMPRAVLVLAVLGLPPMIYCGILHFQGVALFERFFLPSVVAVVMATAVGFSEITGRCVSMRPRIAAWGAAAAVILVGTGLLAIGARDVYYNKQGYLLWRAERSREYSQGLAQLADVDLKGKKLVAYGWFHAQTNLVLRTQVRDVSHDWEALTVGIAGDRLSAFDYLLYGEGDGDVDRLFHDMVCHDNQCTLVTPTAHFETFWVSPEGEFKFFKKTT